MCLLWQKLPFIETNGEENVFYKLISLSRKKFHKKVSHGLAFNSNEENELPSNFLKISRMRVHS